MCTVANCVPRLNPIKCGRKISRFFRKRILALTRCSRSVYPLKSARSPDFSDRRDSMGDRDFVRNSILSWSPCSNDVSNDCRIFSFFSLRFRFSSFSFSPLYKFVRFKPSRVYGGSRAREKMIFYVLYAVIVEIRRDTRERWKNRDRKAKARARARDSSL